MSITNKGKTWEILNSLWILWSFTLMLNCVGFFWIGGRSGKRKWIVSGIIYFLVDFALFCSTTWLEQANKTLFNVAEALIILGWSCAILQSFLSRKEYLLRREAVLDLEKATRDAYRNEIRGEYLAGSNGQPIQPPVQRPVQPSVQPRPVQPMGRPMTPPANLPQQPAPVQPAPAMAPVGVQPPPAQNKLDLNIAAEQQLAALPGVGVVLAKRAVELRTQSGFASVDDFCARLQLMPHFAVQIQNLAFVSPPASGQKPLENAGRIIDI